MRDACSAALEAALGAGASYADARALAIRRQSLGARHGRPSEVSEDNDMGLAVRVLCEGAWGFAAGPNLAPAAVVETARQAVHNARACGQYRLGPVSLAPEPAHGGHYETPLGRDPWSVSLEDKLALLTACSAALEAEKCVTMGHAQMQFRREEQHLLTSDGIDVAQILHFASAGLNATSVGPGGIQERSYPNSWGQAITGGYELLDELDLLAHAPAVAAEAAALQTAPPCPSGQFDVIIDSTQLSLQIHESVGHPLELDRVLGGEANYAGTSFATTDQLGSLRYGSELVNLTADATLPRGVGSFGYDDEGVAAQRWPLVADGVLRGYLTSREHAAAIGEGRSRGAMRAEGWRHVPIIRMVNISLEPGREPLSLDELIADTGRGLLLCTNRSWSIDQRRVNFQFGCEAAWEIRDGRLGRLLRDPVYHGLTTQFWGSCDAICDAREWQPWGLLNCGKGQPPQIAEMTHGASPARFRRLSCGAAG